MVKAMATYAIGDIHGCYDEWKKLMKMIKNQDRSARFIFVGNVIDRGPQSKKMLRWCKHHISKKGKYRMVIGNHEYECIKRRKNTFEKTFFGRLPFHIDIVVNNRRFIIAHSDIPDSVIQKDFSLKKQAFLNNKEKLAIVWNRSTEDVKIPDAILVHGHTPTIFKEAFKPENYSLKRLARIYVSGNRINVDCGVGYLFRTYRRLAAIRLEDLKEFYLECSYINNATKGGV